MSSPPISSWPRFPYQACIPFHGAGLRSKQKTVGCPHSSHAVTASVGTSWLRGLYHSMLDAQVGKAMDDYSQTAACTTPLTLWTLASREEASRLVPALFLCPISKVCNIYNRIMPSNSGKEPQLFHSFFHDVSLALGVGCWNRCTVYRWVFNCHLFSSYWLVTSYIGQGSLE